mgnify:CR=1 FL=1
MFVYGCLFLVAIHRYRCRYDGNSTASTSATHKTDCHPNSPNVNLTYLSLGIPFDGLALLTVFIADRRSVRDAFFNINHVSTFI